MEIRKTKVACPACKNCKVEAIEVVKGLVSSYRCDCGAVFDAEVYLDRRTNRRWWIGRQRNPEFWTMENKNIAEGIQIMNSREQAGIADYLDTFSFEEIKQGK